jgi:hypothetical protein
VADMATACNVPSWNGSMSSPSGEERSNKGEIVSDTLRTTFRCCSYCHGIAADSAASMSLWHGFSLPFRAHAVVSPRFRHGGQNSSFAIRFPRVAAIRVELILFAGHRAEILHSAVEAQNDDIPLRVILDVQGSSCGGGLIWSVGIPGFGKSTRIWVQFSRNREL